MRWWIARYRRRKVVEVEEERRLDDKVEEGGEEVVDDKVEDGEEGEYEVTTRTKYNVHLIWYVVQYTYNVRRTMQSVVCLPYRCNMLETALRWYV